MTIWILAVLLLASLAGLGYRQGAIRVAFSLVGILFGAALAVPLGGLLKPVLSLVGVKSPLLLGVLAPFLVFAIILAIFKFGGLAVHKKTEVHYKYKAGDLRYALWERVHHRLGLCLGLLNGTAYLILLSFVIYAFSYLTIQMANADSDPISVRLLNRMGKDLESTGMIKVARAVDKMPAAYYEAADVTGMLYHTSALEARLSRYPAFLSIGERPEFQDLASDSQFTDLRQKQAPVSEWINQPKAQAILKNPELLKTIWAAAKPNLRDLTNFLATGQSETFSSEKLLGRWSFDVNGAIALHRKTRPNLTSNQAAQLKNSIAAAFGRTSLVATPERQAFLKNVPRGRTPAGAPPATELQTLQGEWKNSGGKYEMTFTVDGKAEPVVVEFEGSRLNITGEGIPPLAFTRES
jgi:hypothetical protein